MQRDELSAVRGAREEGEELEEGVVSYKARLKKMAGSQRSAHKRKDAKAHVKRTRPHNKTGRARATSRITRSATLKLSYADRAKSREGSFAQKQMMTLRKEGGLGRMRKMFDRSGRLDFVDRRRIHADTRSMMQTRADRRNTHLKSDFTPDHTLQFLRDETVINKGKETGMSRALQTLKSIQRDSLMEYMQNNQERYGAKPRYSRGAVSRNKVAGGRRKLKVKRDVVQSVRDAAKSAEKSRRNYYDQQERLRDLEMARQGR